MKAVKVVSIALALTASALSSAVADSYFMDGEVLLMTRNPVGNETLFEVNNVPVSANSLLEYEWAPGFAASLGYNFGKAQSVQLRGFWLAPMEGSSLTFNNDQFIDAGSEDNVNPDGPDLASGDAAYAASFDIESRIWGVGGLYSYDVGDLGGISLGVHAGPRYIRFAEDMGSKFFDEEDDYLGTNNEVLDSQIAVTNNLYGADAGISLGIKMGGGLSLAAELGLGLYANNANRSRNVQDPQEPFSLVDDASATSFAGSIESSVGLSYAINDMITASAGYRMLYLMGVATTTGEFANSAISSDSFDPSSSALFHGGFLGVNIRL